MYTNIYINQCLFHFFPSTRSIAYKYVSCKTNAYPSIIPHMYVCVYIYIYIVAVIYLVNGMVYYGFSNIILIVIYNVPIILAIL